MGATDDKPRIFVFINGGWGPGDLVAVAIAEDGACLASHISSSVGWSKIDMGANGTNKHEAYGEHYEDCMAAIQLNQAKAPVAPDGLDPEPRP